MAQRDRFVSAEVAESQKRLAQELRPFWRDYARPVEIVFETANVARQVLHGLDAVPDGYIIVRATGALYALEPAQWTATLATLTAPVVNTRAVLIFYTLREEALVV